jgi:hypothetical protein
LRFRRHVRLWPTYLWFGVASLIVAIPLALIVGVAYLNGFVDGVAHTAPQSQAVGHSQTCERLAHQVNWAINTARTTGQSTNAIIEAEAAAYAYTCGPYAYPTADPYFPGGISTTPLNTKPTIPLARATPRIPCPLRASSCPQEGIN